VQSTLWERYDRSLAEISTVELAYLVGVEGRRYRRTKALAVLAPCAKPARTRSRRVSRSNSAKTASKPA